MTRIQNCREVIEPHPPSHTRRGSGLSGENGGRTEFFLCEGGGFSVIFLYYSLSARRPVSRTAFGDLISSHHVVSRRVRHRCKTAAGLGERSINQTNRGRGSQHPAAHASEFVGFDVVLASLQQFLISLHLQKSLRSRCLWWIRTESLSESFKWSGTACCFHRRGASGS